MRRRTSGNIVFRVAASAADQNLTSTFSVTSTEDTTARHRVGGHRHRRRGRSGRRQEGAVAHRRGRSGAERRLHGRRPEQRALRRHRRDAHRPGPDRLRHARPSAAPARAPPAASGRSSRGQRTRRRSRSRSAVPDNYHIQYGTASVTNTATAATRHADRGASDLSDAVPTPIVPKVELSVVVSSAATSVTPGTAGGYVITVSKSGPSRLERLHVTGAMSLLGAVFTPSEGIFSATSISPNWIGLDLAGTDSATLTVQRLGEPGPARGVSRRDRDDPAPAADVADTSAANDTDTESDTISRLSDLSHPQDQQPERAHPRARRCPTRSRCANQRSERHLGGDGRRQLRHRPASRRSAWSCAPRRDRSPTWGNSWTAPAASTASTAPPPWPRRSTASTSMRRPPPTTRSRCSSATRRPVCSPTATSTPTAPTPARSPAPPRSRSRRTADRSTSPASATTASKSSPAPPSPACWSRSRPRSTAPPA